MTTQAEALSDTPMFRVEIDWRGGGLGYTIPFPDAEAATRWALGKAKGHPGAIVNVEERPYRDSEAARRNDARAAAHELRDNPFSLAGWK